VKFKYDPVTEATVVRQIYHPGSRQKYPRAGHIPILNGRLTAVFTEGNNYLGYLIQIGFDLHAIARDGVRVDPPVLWHTTQKNRAAMNLYDYETTRTNARS
jgi:hypothetical protein